MKGKNKDSEEKIITEKKKELDRSEAVEKEAEKTWLEELEELEPKDGVFAVPKEFITLDGELDFEKLKKHTEEARMRFAEKRED